MASLDTGSSGQTPSIKILDVTHHINLACSYRISRRALAARAQGYLCREPVLERRHRILQQRYAHAED
jgi:hypothetical protein